MPTHTLAGTLLVTAFVVFLIGAVLWHVREFEQPLAVKLRAVAARQRRWIQALGVSTLYLDRNQTYRGHCQLVFDRRHVVGLERLSADELAALMADLRTAAQAIVSACQPDLMNYASLGNVVPHLHWHLVPRYTTDPRWGAPIYTTTRAERYDRCQRHWRHVTLADRPLCP